MCRVCGREACGDCVDQIRDLTHPVRALTASGERKMHSNSTFLSCTRKQEHAFRDFSPVSRFCQHELDTVVSEMVILLAEEKSRSSALSSREEDRPESTEESVSPDPIMTTAETSSIRTIPGPGTTEDPPTKLLNGLSNYSSPTRYNTDTTDLPPAVISRLGDPRDHSGLVSHPYCVFDKTISDSQFNQLWKDGQTLVVTGLLDNFLIKWTPEHFIQGYGQNQCLILDCNSNENKSVTVGDFFREFGQYGGRSKIWKLKVCPSLVSFVLSE